MSRTDQWLVHKLLLGKAQPPFARLSVFAGKYSFAHSYAGFLANLLQILSHCVRIGRRCRFCVDRIQRKSSLTGNVEFRYGQRVHVLQALVFVAATLQLFQAFCDVQRYVDKYTIDFRLKILETQIHWVWDTNKNSSRLCIPLSRMCERIRLPWSSTVTHRWHPVRCWRSVPVHGIVYATAEWPYCRPTDCSHEFGSDKPGRKGEKDGNCVTLHITTESPMAPHTNHTPPCYLLF